MEAPRDPEELEAEGVAHGEIAAATTMGAVHLTVSDLDRSLDYYERAIGLETPRERPRVAPRSAAAGRELLVLVEEPGARPSDPYTGLYHFALLVPERPGARALARARRPRPRLADRALRPLRQRGDLPPRPRRPRDRDLRRPAPRAVGRHRGRADDDAPARRRQPPRRARRPGDRAVRRARRRDRDGPRPPEGRRDPGHGRVLPRRDRLRPDRGSSASRRRSSAPAATTTISARTPGRAPGPCRPRPGTASLRHATIVLPDAAERDRVAGAARGARSAESPTRAATRSCAIRRGTRSCSRSPPDAARSRLISFRYLIYRYRRSSAWKRAEAQ